MMPAPWLALGVAVLLATGAVATACSSSSSNGGETGGAAAHEHGGSAGSTTTAGAGGAGAPCTTASDCDDANPCTDDRCPASHCVHAETAAGTSCDTDHDVCNGADACAAGVCEKGTPIVSDDGDACTADKCDPLTGKVTHASLADAQKVPGCFDATCDPKTGLVTLVDLSDDHDACTDDSCDASTGAVHTKVTFHDHDPCTTDACDPTTGVTHTMIEGCTNCTADAQCDFGNPCETPTCATPGATSGSCANAAKPDATSCTDGDYCNGPEVCAAGFCQTGAPPSIDDGNPCTNDRCDPTVDDASAVTHVPIAMCK